MSADHFDRKDLQHDPYRDAVFAGIQYVYARRRPFVIGAAVATVLIAAGVGWYAYVSHAERVESDALIAASQTLQAPAGSSAPAQTQDQRYDAATKAFQAFVTEHPRSRMAPPAWLFLARIAWERKRLDEAGADFQHVLDHGKSTPLMKAQALLGLGKLKEAQGKPAEAITLYEQMAEAFQDLRQLNLGRAALAAGNIKEAREHFLQASGADNYPVVTSQAKEELNYLP